MLGSNRFRHQATPRDNRTDEQKQRDWIDHATIWVQTLSLVALVVATILTQIDQVSSSRDTQNAIDRLTSMASSSKAEASALKDQANASVAMADAAKSQADTSRKQVDSLRHSLAAAQQSATAAKLLAATARDNFLSEKEYRQNNLISKFPVLTADASVSVRPIEGFPDASGLYLDLLVHNNGQTAAKIERMTFYLQEGDLGYPQSVTFHYTQAANKIVVAGGQWQLPSEQLGLTPDNMEAFMKGEISISVAWIYEVTEYTGNRHLQCQAFNFMKRKDRFDVYNEACPILNEVSFLEQLKGAEANKRLK